MFPKSHIIEISICPKEVFQSYGVMLDHILSSRPEKATNTFCQQFSFWSASDQDCLQKSETVSEYAGENRT